MSWFILEFDDGTSLDSRLVNNLIVSDVPAMVLPEMRINETVIDGVDGSFVEELGYASYTKEINIGISSPSFDFDSFFSSLNKANKGASLILSNEPTKYYRVRLSGRVDMQRLLIFHTATLRFLTQPFKYKYNESHILINSTYSLMNNQGNMPSLPLLKLTGTAGKTVKVILTKGSTTVSSFEYTFPTGETEVFIDCEKKDAYTAGGLLRNRQMVGSFFEVPVGNEHYIEKSTNSSYLSQIDVLLRTRWL